MESLSPQVVSAAKLLILNPNEFDLWKMRIEVIEGIVQPVAPTTAEQSLARNNELKARGTLLMALPNKHQLKFNIHKDAKTLKEAIKKSAAASVSAVSAKIPVSALLNVDTLSNAVIYSFFASQSNSPQLDNDDLKQIDADDLEEIDLKWQMAMLTVRARRFLQRTGRNLEANGPTFMGFDMSKVECYNCHRKGHFTRKCRSPKDTKRNGAAEPQRRNVPVEEEPTNYALMALTSSSSTNTDNEVVSCSKACTKAYATLQSHYDKLTDDFKKSQFDVISYKTELESRLLVYQQNETVFEEDIKLLKLEVQLRDNALVVLRKKFEKAKQERDDLKLKLEKFQTPSKNLSQLLASQTNDKTGLGYNTEVFTHSMFDCNEFFTSESDESLPPSPIYDRPCVKTVETSIPTANTKTTIHKPKSNGNRMNRKACFECKSLDHLIKDCDFYEEKMAQTPVRNHAQRGNHQQYARMTLLNPQRHVVPTAVLTKSKLNAARPITVVVPKTHVTRPRPAKPIVTKPHSPPGRNINHSPSPKASTFPPKVTAAKAPMVNVVKGKWE
nr:hypothetical protein [Tanacetum cinerariifolium]